MNFDIKPSGNGIWKVFFVSGLRKALLPSSSCCLPLSTPYSTFPGFFHLLALTLAKTKIPPRSRMKERNLSICLLLKSQETLQQLEPGWPQTILITSRIHNRSVFHVYLVFFFFICLFSNLFKVQERLKGSKIGAGIEVRCLLPRSHQRRKVWSQLVLAENVMTKHMSSFPTNNWKLNEILLKYSWNEVI